MTKGEVMESFEKSHTAEIREKTQAGEWKTEIWKTLSTNLHVCFINICPKKECCVQ